MGKKMKKPKYKVGDKVYSWQNPTVKRAINRITPPDDLGIIRYRLTLINKDGDRQNSKWTNESSLSKRRLR